MDQGDVDRILAEMSALSDEGRDRKPSVHEAGHAVVAIHLGFQVERADIEARECKDGPAMGRVTIPSVSDVFSAAEIDSHSPQVIDHIVKHIAVLFSGAEAKTQIDNIADRLDQVDASLIRLARRDFPEVESRMDEARQLCRDTVRAHRTDIERLAKQLQAKRVLSGVEVQRIVKGIE